MREQATDIAAIAQKVTVSAGGVSLFGGFTANEIAAFGGLMIAALGFIVQLYYKRKEDRRRDEAHRALMKAARE